MAFLTSAWYRLRSTYFLPCRLGEYREFIKGCASYGYEMHSIISFWWLLSSGASVSDGKYMILRHDVDSDAATAEKMWSIEQEFGARSSFYFRLCTLDFDLMRRIEQSGSEASYHYEELATFAKQRCIRRPEELLPLMPEIQRTFADNIGILRQQSGLPMISVASHGDFANRHLGMANWMLLEPYELRTQLGIEVEVYDEKLMNFVSSRHSDIAQYPALWNPSNPIGAVRRSEPVIYVLTHPGRWSRNRAELVEQDTLRLVEGIRYRLSR